MTALSEGVGDGKLIVIVPPDNALVTLAEKIRTKQLSATEVTEAVLGRMEKLNPTIGAFCTPAPDIARQLHPDRRKNEADYWAVRDQLLGQYRNQWIGFADGKVVASASSPVAVFHAAEATGLHPFFICVGREEEPCRIRRAAFPYDSGYLGGPYRHRARPGP